MTAHDLVEKIGVNKTTIYRELSKLVLEGEAVEVDFGDGKKRYELAKKDHHHHAICTKCNLIKDVRINERGLDLKIKNFFIQRHSVEFFGLCNNCR